MLKSLSIALVFAALAFGGTARTETAKKGPNGGAVVIVQGHPIEFIYTDQDITFYIVNDDGKTPVPTKGVHARAVIQSGGKTTTVNLTPADPNKLVGKLQTPLGPKARIVMSTTIIDEGHKHTLQVRFAN